MEMLKENLKIEEMEETMMIKKKGDTLYDVPEVLDFLYHKCFSVPDISINEGEKFATNLKWIRINLDVNLNNIKNIRYINEKTLEIKYMNGDVICIFAD